MEDDPLAFLRGEAQPLAPEAGSAAGNFSILVTLETDGGGDAVRASKEVAGKALELKSQLGACVTGCVIGKDAYEQAKEFVHLGLDRIFVFQFKDKEFSVFDLVKWVGSEQTWLWLFTDSNFGRTLAARAAARLNTGLVTGVTQMDLNLDDRVVEFSHTEWGGKMRRTLAIKFSRPQMATLSKGSGFTPVENTSISTEIQRLEF